MLERDSLELWRSRMKSVHLALCERPLLSAARAVQVTTAQERRNLLDPSWADKAHVIPVGIELPALTPARVGRPGRVLFYSRIHPKKRPEWVIEAVAAGAAREAVFAGSAEPRYLASLRALADRLNVDDRVRFVGHVDRAEAARLLDSSQLFVLPSKTENFAAVVAQAWARGCPTVTTPGVALSEVASETGAGAVSADDKHAFFAAVRETLAAPPPPRVCRAAAARFSWDRVLQDLDALYERVATMNGRRAA
jgi:glycosyltransferase involved in cell wall biosynthesis